MLIAAYYPDFGGAEVFAQEIAERLVKEGNEVDVITGRTLKGSKSFEVIKGVNVYRVRLVSGKYWFKYLSLFSYAFVSIITVFILHKRRNCDLIHAIEVFGAGLPGVILKRLIKKPLLVTVQGGYFSEEGSPLRKRILGRLERWCLKNASVVHVISEYLGERARRRGAESVVVIPNGIDERVFYPVNKDEAKKKAGVADERVILSICPGYVRHARPFSYKSGYPELIHALSNLSSQFPNLRLVLIGEGNIRGELDALAAELGIRDKVSFLGFISHKELASYLAMADIFIRPSLVEGLGIAFIEAMACGVPVIGTDVGGIPDIIEHDKNGFLIRPQDRQGMVQALRALLEDEDLRSRFITKGLETVRQKFHWDAIFEQVEGLYANLT